MEFKFDTKNTYTVITPLADVLDVNLTANLLSEITVFNSEGANNFIIDMQSCTTADNTSLMNLAELHDWCYENGRSLVFTGLQPDVMHLIQQNDMTETLNIAPTMIEAVDIISMEILERDLFGEEDDLETDI